jgi:archaellum component FlaC
MDRAKAALTLTTTILLLLLVVAPALAVITVTVTTDKDTYSPGDTLIVSGTVSPVTAGQDVAITVYGPLGDLKAVDQATPAADGTYSKAVLVFSSTDPTGTWTVRATYMGASDTKTFAFTGGVAPTPTAPPTALSVAVDGGNIYFPGEIAEFYILVSYNGAPVEANVSTRLYGPTGAPITSARTATGLYMITLAIPANAPAGTYTLVANASTTISGYPVSGVALKSFLISPTLTAWDAKLISINGTVAEIKTDVRIIKMNLTDIKATIVSIQDTVVTINSTVGQIKADLSAINATVVAINGTVATIKTDVGSISGKVTSIDGNVATIKTDVGTVKMDISALKSSVDDVKDTVETVPGAVSGLIAPIWAAVILSLIAAIAAIYAVITIHRKIAG